MVIQPLIGNPYSGNINPYYWVDSSHPLLYMEMSCELIDPIAQEGWWEIPMHQVRFVGLTHGCRMQRHGWADMNWLPSCIFMLGMQEPSNIENICEWNVYLIIYIFIFNFIYIHIPIFQIWNGCICQSCFHSNSISYIHNSSWVIFFDVNLSPLLTPKKNGSSRLPTPRRGGVLELWILRFMELGLLKDWDISMKSFEIPVWDSLIRATFTYVGIWMQQNIIYIYSFARFFRERNMKDWRVNMSILCFMGVWCSVRWWKCWDLALTGVARFFAYLLEDLVQNTRISCRFMLMRDVSMRNIWLHPVFLSIYIWGLLWSYGHIV